MFLLTKRKKRCACAPLLFLTDSQEGSRDFPAMSVPNDFDIVHGETIDIFDVGVEPQLGRSVGFVSKLLHHSGEVALLVVESSVLPFSRGVDVGILKRDDELTWHHIDTLCHHVQLSAYDAMLNGTPRKRSHER